MIRALLALAILAVVLFFVMSSVGLIHPVDQVQLIDNKIKSYQEDIAEIQEKINKLEEKKEKIQSPL
jgi:hypothetical protein